MNEVLSRVAPDGIWCWSDGWKTLTCITDVNSKSHWNVNFKHIILVIRRPQHEAACERISVYFYFGDTDDIVEKIIAASFRMQDETWELLDCVAKSNFSIDLSRERGKVHLEKTICWRCQNVFRFISEIDFRLRVQICLELVSYPCRRGFKSIKKFHPITKNCSPTCSSNHPKRFYFPFFCLCW